VLLSSTGLLARTSSADPLPAPDPAHRSAHDVVVACVPATARGEVAAVTSTGRMVRLPVLDMPALPPTSTAPSLSGGAPLAEFLALAKNEHVVTLALAAHRGGGLALGTAQGVVKRVTADYPSGKTEWEMIALRDDDSVVGAVELPHEQCDLVFVTSDAQLLRFGAEKVRPQGRAAGGMAGVNLAPGARVILVRRRRPDTSGRGVAQRRRHGRGDDRRPAGDADRDRQGHPVRRVPDEGPGDRRRPLPPVPQGEDTLLLAWAGPAPAIAAGANGVAVPAARARLAAGRIRDAAAGTGGGGRRADRRPRVTAEERSVRVQAPRRPPGMARR
jgi:DNA gyrase subunit A